MLILMYPVTSFPEHPPPYSFSPSDGNINDLTGVPCPPTGDEAGRNQYRDFKYFQAVYIKIPKNRLPPLPTLTHEVKRLEIVVKKNFHSHCQLYFCLIRKVVL